MKSGVKNPKFAIGQHVTCKPTIYRETEGYVTEIDRIFAEVKDGRFVRNGFRFQESTIGMGALPMKLVDDVLTIYFEQPMVLHFHHFAYTVKTPQILTMFSARHLTPIL